MPSYCFLCAEPAKLRCGRCKGPWYCSRDCQRDDWKRHAPACAIPKKAVPKPVIPQIPRNVTPKTCAKCDCQLPEDVRDIVYNSCCGKTCCIECGRKHKDHRCGFCGEKACETTTQALERLEQRIQVNEEDAGQALNLLSGHHMRGEGVPMNPNESIRLRDIAIQKGDRESLCNRGLDELQREDPKARETLGKAAALHCPAALLKLGTACFNGVCGPPDKTIARRCFEILAAQKGRLEGEARMKLCSLLSTENKEGDRRAALAAAAGQATQAAKLGHALAPLALDSLKIAAVREQKTALCGNCLAEEVILTAELDVLSVQAGDSPSDDSEPGETRRVVAGIRKRINAFEKLSEKPFEDDRQYLLLDDDIRPGRGARRRRRAAALGAAAMISGA